MKTIARRIRKKICRAAMILLAAGFSHAAYADAGIDQGESYANPTLRDLVQSSILMDTYDLKDPTVVDDYAKLLYCDLYAQKYSDDFEWNNIRTDLTSRITNKKEYYRVLYQYSGPVYLGRYSFETQDFPFEKKTSLVNVGTMEMLVPTPGVDKKAAPSACFASINSLSFPKAYKVKLTEPLTIDRLKMATGPAQVLLDKMLAQNNTDRRVYLRYRVKLVTSAKFGNKRDDKTYGTFIGQLTAVDVFLDEQLTQYVANIPLNKE